MMGVSGFSGSNSSTTIYIPIANTRQFVGGFSVTNEVNAKMQLYPCKVKSIYATVSTAPGAGTSWTYTLRTNITNTAATTTISGTNTSANTTGLSVQLNLGDNTTFSIVPASSPTNNVNFGVGYCVTFTQNHGFYL